VIGAGVTDDTAVPRSFITDTGSVFNIKPEVTVPNTTVSQVGFLI